MKASISLDNGGALTLEALASIVVLQVGAWGLRPVTVTLTPEQGRALEAVARTLASVANDQRQELAEVLTLADLRARRAKLGEPPRHLAPVEGAAGFGALPFDQWGPGHG